MPTSIALLQGECSQLYVYTHTLQGTITYPTFGKLNIILKHTLNGDMIDPSRVYQQHFLMVCHGGRGEMLKYYLLNVQLRS